MVRAQSTSLTADNTRVNGRMTKCTVEAYSLGQTEGNILADMLTTKNKELANTFGLVGECIKVSGLTGSNMVTESLQMPKENANKESGTMGK